MQRLGWEGFGVPRTHHFCPFHPDSIHQVPVETEDVTGFARAIADAQRFMRQQLSSESAVSQRDIIRVIRLLATRHRRFCKFD